jgi:microcystin-dependent protein
MSLAFVGEIRAVAFTFAPSGWMLCQGQTLSIAQNEVLFVLLGTTYGGDGVSTFRLPDLRGRTPIHFGNSVGGSYVIGMQTGQESITPTALQIPAHSHGLNAQAPPGTNSSPAGSFLAGASTPYYSTVRSGSTAAVLLPGSAAQPHSNLQPYLCLNYAISLFGVFPSRN